MTLRAALLATTVVLLAAGCGGSREPTDSERAARRHARLDACIADALQRRAGANLATLDTLLEQTRGADAPALVSAPHAFARAYASYADLRAHEAAYRDSAYSAGSREDSVRFAGLAASFRVARPSPGSLEANVHQDYARDFAASRRIPDHPCNRLVGAEERGSE
jgi:hypothetical protein